MNHIFKNIISLRHIIAVIMIINSILSVSQTPLRLKGRVKDLIWKTDLTAANIVTFDSHGVPVDTLKANQGAISVGDETTVLSEFILEVPRTDSIYVFDVICEGYNRKTITYEVKNVGSRELARTIPVIFLERAPKQLGEVSVVASKIKFYNRGDTVVYNADAFQLAEGSMLDALIAQLPGVELNRQGQIKVNGEYVESLLLNGKDFFDGEKNLLLENISAYTVKNIEVYEGNTPTQLKLNLPGQPKVLIMNVKLKKEYNIGLTANLQGGYGSSDRYLGRLYSSFFNSTTQVMFVGNINNLNDNRSPGKQDNWAPGESEDGVFNRKKTGFTYNYDSTDDRVSAFGNLLFSNVSSHERIQTNRVNFLPEASTTDVSLSNSSPHSTSISIDNMLYVTLSDNINLDNSISARYETSRIDLNNHSITFNTDPGELDSNLIEAIYSDNIANQLPTIINYAKTKNNSNTKIFSGQISQGLSYKFKGSDDRIYFDIAARYDVKSPKEWNEYIVNTGVPENLHITRRHYIDGTPNHTLLIEPSLTYSFRLPDCVFNLIYRYNFEDKISDHTTYSLELLDEMGDYGQLPDNYLPAYNPQLSYLSRLITNRHIIEPQFSLNKTFTNKNSLNITLSPQVSYIHRNFGYTRDNRLYNLTQSYGLVSLASRYSFNVKYNFDFVNQSSYRHTLQYSLKITPRLPNPYSMVDIINDADPLNVYIGNPDLKTQYDISHYLSWTWRHPSAPLYNVVQATPTIMINALTQGFIYDCNTGIHTNKTYNVSGNYSLNFTDNLNWQFGTIKQFTLATETKFTFQRLVNIIGTNIISPQPQKVNFLSFTQNIRLNWQLGNHSIGPRCDLILRDTKTTDGTVSPITAIHLTYGITGSFKLPYGLGVNADFNCFTRRGYGEPNLNTTDAVLNVRLSYTPRQCARLSIFADAYDLLHQLSNVNYAVTASGRTVTLVNSLPRYFMLSIQYRFNKQPRH